MRSYAIGDIHGHLGKLILAHDLIEADRLRTGDREAPVVHVGDLVDRGPDSRGVVDHLLDGIADGEPWVVLKGNHDRLFANFMEDPAHQDSGLRPIRNWLSAPIGGRETLLSYGVHSALNGELLDVHEEALNKVPLSHVTFLRDLPTSYARGEAIFVHAGIRPGVPMDRQTEHDLVWIRHDFLNDTRDHGALIVHGHTPIDEATHYGNRLAIDSGAAFGGPLSAVVIEGRDAWLLTEDGREELRPYGLGAL